MSPVSSRTSGLELPGLCRKESEDRAYLQTSRAWVEHRQKPRKPPDRSNLPTATPLHVPPRVAMALSAQEEQVPLATEANPVVGGGEYGAPTEAATRPKPSVGGPEEAVARNPRMQTLSTWNQMGRVAPGSREQVIQERKGTGSDGPEEFWEGDESDGEIELPEVDLEKEDVLQKESHPWTVIILVYSLDPLSDGSSLGKRNAGEEHMIDTGDAVGEKALVVYSNKADLADRIHASTPKRRTMQSLEQQQTTSTGGGMHDQDMQEMASTMEAVGPGAADELTGPVEPRQEQ
jgi:hypothetical protein